MLTVEQWKKLLGKSYEHLSDEKIQEMLNILAQLGQLNFNMYLQSKWEMSQ